MVHPHHNQDNPHQGQPLVTGGTALTEASAAAILVHGRGASARSILQMGNQFHREGLALLAPQAAGNTWYPNPFTTPVESNEPGRTSGLQAIDDAISEANEADIPTERILVGGFSQGGCLSSEFVARNPQRYGGLIAFSGGLIGETIDASDYEGDLAGTPAFLGCSNVDPHIPEQRVHDTATVLEQLNAAVETRIYDGMAHTVNQDELRYAAELVGEVLE